jgi:hypothetical protein
MDTEKRKEIEKIATLDIRDDAKIKYFIRLSQQHPELYEPIIKLLIENEHENLLALFLEADYTELPTKRKIAPATSVSGWTAEQLEDFCIEFKDTAKISDICPVSEINTNAKKILDENKDIDGPFSLTNESQISTLMNTPFKGYLLYVQNSPSVESCVDDTIRELLQQTLGENFLVKTRYDMTLNMSNKLTKATADLLAIFIPKLYMGVIIVEDKPQDTSETKNQHSNAEAQMVAEAVAIVQQERWPTDKPIFMLRVLGTNITFYKACFTRELISSIKTGSRRTKPFLITKHEHRDPFFPNKRPGYDILKKEEREIAVQIISNIGNYITTMLA